MASLRLLLERTQRLGFPHITSLQISSVLLWLQVAAQIPDLINIILSSLDDATVVTMACEAIGIFQFLSAANLSVIYYPISPSLSALIAGRNASFTIWGNLIGESEGARSTIEEIFARLYTGNLNVRRANDCEAGSSSSSSSSSATLPQSWYVRVSSPQPRLNPESELFVPLNSVEGGGEDRTCLFLTFSDGLPLSGQEISDFFSWLFWKLCGCGTNKKVVKYVFVKKEKDGKKMFGKVFFCNPYLAAFILSGREYVDFEVHGKSLRCKKFIPRKYSHNRSDTIYVWRASDIVPQGGGDAPPAGQFLPPMGGGASNVPLHRELGVPANVGPGWGRSQLLPVMGGGRVVPIGGPGILGPFVGGSSVLGLERGISVPACCYPLGSSSALRVPLLPSEYTP